MIQTGAVERGTYLRTQSVVRDNEGFFWLWSAASEKASSIGNAGLHNSAAHSARWTARPASQVRKIGNRFFWRENTVLHPCDPFLSGV